MAARPCCPRGITMALYFVIFGNLIGQPAIWRDGRLLPIFDYYSAGLIHMSVITKQLFPTWVFEFLSAPKFQRSIEELMVAPVSPHVILPRLHLFGGVAAGWRGSDRHADVAVLHPVAGPASGPYRFGRCVFFNLAGVRLGWFLFNCGLAKTSTISPSSLPLLTPSDLPGGVFLLNQHLLPEFWRKVSIDQPGYWHMSMPSATAFWCFGYPDPVRGDI